MITEQSVQSVDINSFEPTVRDHMERGFYIHTLIATAWDSGHVTHMVIVFHKDSEQI